METHTWKVSFRNEKMGFQKTLVIKPEKPEDDNFLSAVALGQGMMKSQGYDLDFFVVTDIHRIPQFIRPALASDHVADSEGRDARFTRTDDGHENPDDLI